MNKWIWFIIAIIVIVIIVFAYYYMNYTTTPGGSTKQTQTITATVNSVYNSQIGSNILVDDNGKTLYTFSSDTPNNSTCYNTCPSNSKCEITCQDYWPPIEISTSQPTVGFGISGTVGTIKRIDGGYQVTYNSMPLYTYSWDSGSSSASGNGVNSFGGIWSVVKA